MLTKLPLLFLIFTVKVNGRSMEPTADFYLGDSKDNQLGPEKTAKCKVLMNQYIPAQSKVERLTRMGKAAVNAKSKMIKLEKLGQQYRCPQFFFTDGPIEDISLENEEKEKAEMMNKKREEMRLTECPRLTSLLMEDFKKFKKTNYGDRTIRSRLDENKQAMREMNCNNLEDIIEEQDDEMMDICDQFSKELDKLGKLAAKEKKEKIRHKMEVAGCSELGNIDDVWVFIVAGEDKAMVESINKDDPDAYCTGLSEQLKEKEDELPLRLKKDPKEKRKRTQALKKVIPALKDMIKRYNCDDVSKKTR